MSEYKPSYKGRRPENRPSGPVTNLKDVLPAISKRLDLDRKVNELAVLALWPVVAGAETAALTRAKSLKRQGAETVLRVTVANATLASDLSFRIAELREALNRYTPQTAITVDQIRFRVGVLD